MISISFKIKFIFKKKNQFLLIQTRKLIENKLIEMKAYKKFYSKRKDQV